MADKFQLVSQFKGYVSKADVTNIEPGYLISGSQNVVSTDGLRIASRKGYILAGAASTTANPIISSYEWKTNRGVEHGLRRYTDTLEVYYESAWHTLKTGLEDDATAVNLVHSNFAEFWDNTNKIDQLLFTDGTANLFSWNGSVAEVSSNAATTLTKSGTTTWAQEGFSATGTVVINGTEYAYTGGSGTTQLTGLVGLPAIDAGTPVFQAVATNAVSGFTDTNTVIPNDYKIDLVAVIDNQVFIGNLESRNIFISKANSYTDYAKSSPRVTAEGEILIIDQTPTGFAVGEYGESQVMYVSTRDFWYVILFEPSADQSVEKVQVKRLKTQPMKGAVSQSAIGNVVNDIMFISGEPTFDTIGRVENVTTVQTKPLSDRIKTDFDSYDLSNAHVKFHRSSIYIALPGESVLLIYNVERGYWEPPQTLPVRRLAVIGGELYAHSNTVQESYKLNEGYNDNENPIDCRAIFSYRNFGDRVKQKNFDEHYSEGYIAGNTTLTLTLLYDYGGFTSTQEFDIEGSDSTILFQTNELAGLGQNPLGQQPIGSVVTEVPDMSKFRIINTMVAQDFYEMTEMFSSNAADYRWEILAFGPAARESSADPVSIKQ
jgi:hypothetical protein